MNSINNILDTYTGFRQSLGALNAQVLQARDEAARHAASEGFPNTRHEEWKYTSLRPFLDAGFKIPTQSAKVSLSGAERVALEARFIPGSRRLVFVDGCWAPDVSNASPLHVTVTQLKEAEQSATERWQVWNQAPGLQSLFGRLAQSFAGYGAVVEIGARQAITEPLHILHVATSTSAKTTRASRVVIVAGEGSESQVFEEFITLGKESSHALPLTQIFAAKNARVGYYRVCSPNEASFHTGQVTIQLDRDSRVETFSLATGGSVSRINIDGIYTAPGAECVLDGLYLVGEGEHIDHHTSIDHTVGQCRTLQLYKGILAGRGRAVFNGKIFIRKQAAGSQAFQTNKNLLLSADAEIDTKPELVIDNDDVKASHGAAIGAIDPMELFYLQSRCIGRAEAEAMLCRGFADEVVMRLENKTAQTILTGRISAWFAGRQ